MTLAKDLCLDSRAEKRTFGLGRILVWVGYRPLKTLKY